MHVVYLSSISGDDDRVVPCEGALVDVDMVVIALDRHLVAAVVAIVAMVLRSRRWRAAGMNVLVVPFDNNLVVTMVRSRRAAVHLNVVIVPLDNDGIMMVVVVVVMVGRGFGSPMEVDRVVIPLDHNLVAVVIVMVVGGRRAVNVNMVAVAFHDNTVVIVVVISIMHMDVVVVALYDYAVVVVVGGPCNPVLNDGTMVDVDMVVVAVDDDLVVVVVIVMMMMSLVELSRHAAIPHILASGPELLHARERVGGIPCSLQYGERKA